MRLHIVGFPHTETTREFVTCAYTSKIVKAGSMFNLLGHDVIVYSGEENDAVCSEHVPLFTRAEREGWYGEHTQESLWGQTEFKAIEPGWQAVNSRGAAAIKERLTGDDLVLILGGYANLPLANEMGATAVCEWGVGYEGVCSKFVAFESSAWMHYVYGKHVAHDCLGRFYDTVIPNFFDVSEFHTGPKTDGYLLFLGRVIRNKGVEIAAEVAARAGRQLVIAGPGAKQARSGKRKGVVVGQGVEVAGDVKYVGPVDVQARAELLAGADALLAPTMYLEPFGGVAVEAMLSGTPAVTTNWGAFRETVEEGVTGYRFNRIAEGVRAVEAAVLLDPETIRAAAVARYSTAAVGLLYDRWFYRLAGLSNGNDFYGFAAPEYARAS